MTIFNITRRGASAAGGIRIVTWPPSRAGSSDQSCTQTGIHFKSKGLLQMIRRWDQTVTAMNTEQVASLLCKHLYYPPPLHRQREVCLRSPTSPSCFARSGRVSPAHHFRCLCYELWQLTTYISIAFSPQGECSHLWGRTQCGWENYE